MPKNFKIGNILIGDKYPPVIIVELGINHNGNLDIAIDIAEKAIQAGAEIIKHQTHIVDDEMSVEAKKVIPGNSNKNIYKIIKSCALNESDERKLMNYIVSKKKFLLALLSLELLRIGSVNLIFLLLKLGRESAIIIFW